MFLTIFLASCGSSIDRDAQKLADLTCETVNLSLKAATGDLSILTESTKLASEVAELTKELDQKYTSAEDKNKLEQAYLKAMVGCE
jgi:hypothetical protein